MTGKHRILFEVDDDIPLSVAITQAFQHILSGFSALVVLPTMIANTISVPPGQLEYVIFAGILVTAITTFIQSVRVGRVGAGYILFTGAASSFIACSISAAQVGGFALVATMAIVAAPMEFLFAHFLGYFRKIITPVVGGVIIMIVSVTLIPLALEFWVGNPLSGDYQSRENLLLGLLTFTIITLINILARARWRVLAPAFGILAGYGAALFFGLVDISHIRELPFIGLPPLAWPGLTFEFSPQYIAIFFTFVIVTLVASMETVGDVMAIQRISKRDYKKIDYQSVQGGLYSDAVGNIMAGLAGTMPNSTFSGNVAIVEMTGVAAKRVGVFTAGILALIAFFPWLTALIMSIPQPVLGGSLFVMFSFLFVTGLKLATQAGLDARASFIVGVSFWIGFSTHNNLFFPDLIPSALEPFLTNGVAVGGLTAFLLSALFSFLGGKKASFFVHLHLSELNQIQKTIRETGIAFNLSEKALFQLQLLCEEVFLHFLHHNPGEDEKGNRIRYTISLDEQGMLVEVQNRSEVEYIDLATLPSDVGRASREELETLGLGLIMKVGEEVVHHRISGMNYISFRLSPDA